MNFLNIFSNFLLIVMLSACSNSKEVLMLNESPFYYNYIQNNFSNYVEATESWLSINREFVTSNVEQEMSMNMPFMTTNESEDNKAILLVHGLNDSPFTFRDIAQDLAKHGFHVQVILLPGHGSKPQDMFLPQLNDWESLVSHYAQILQNNYSEVWLGGFSTGANLVTSYAILNEGISGLMLFSPAFLSKSPLLEHMTQYIPSKIDIVDYEKQRNLAKYDSAPFNGLKVYSGSAIKVRQLLSSSNVDIPTIILLSEHDSVVDSKVIMESYFEKFTHHKARILWFGRNEVNMKRVKYFDMDLPEHLITSASHMSVMFSQDNFYYGKYGEKRICFNGLGSISEHICENSDSVWYGAWGDDQNGEIHARLTWNPYYKEMIKEILYLTNGDKIIKNKQRY